MVNDFVAPHFCVIGIAMPTGLRDASEFIEALQIRPCGCQLATATPSNRASAFDPNGGVQPQSLAGGAELAEGLDMNRPLVRRLASLLARAAGLSQCWAPSDPTPS
jgi:hypothetical protein